MGEVYRAHDAELGREVAIKIIAGPRAADEATVERFFRETRAAAALSHPAIVAVHDVGTHEGSPFLVTELLDGETLRARIERGALGVRAGVDLAIQIAHGLAAAHARGILHRDLKPDNLFLTSDGGAKILDFGLAKLTPFVGGLSAAAPDVTSAQLTQSGTVLGTPAYMAPEQAEGREVDHRGTSSRSASCSTRSSVGSGLSCAQPCTRRSPRFCAMNLVTSRPFDPSSRTASRVSSLVVSRKSRRLDTSPRGISPRRSKKYVTICAPRTRHLSMSFGSSSGGCRRFPQASSLECCFWCSAAPPGSGSLRLKPQQWRCFHSARSAHGDQYFADGITEAVTTELGRVGGLRVIASNSTFAYRDKTTFRDIGRELGVGLVVRGSVQRADGKVRIDVSLVNTRDDTAMWSERYSRELTDVLTVQDDISRQIATTLSTTFGAAPTGRSPSLATANPDAYDAYLRGLWHLKARSSNYAG